MFRAIAGSYRDAFRGLPLQVWLLCLVAFVNRVGSMVLPFLSLYLAQERGLSIVAAGRIFAFYGLGGICGALLGGWASDRIGSTRTQIASLVAGGAGYLGFLALESPAAVAAGAFVLSAVVDSLRPAVMADMAERTPPALQPRAFVLLRLAINLGFGIGPAVGGILALHGYHWLFIADAATCWLAAALLAVTLGRRARIRTAEEKAAPLSGTPAWRDGPFLLFMLLLICLASAFFQVFSTLPLYLRGSYGLREDVIGLLLSMNAAVIVAFEMVLIHRLERQRRLPLIALGSFLICAGLGLTPFGSSFGFLALTVAIWTLGEMLALPLANAVVAERARGRHGQYMGLYTMAFSAAFVIGPLTGTWIYDRFGPDRLWHAIGALGLLLGIGALLLEKPLRQTREV